VQPLGYFAAAIKQFLPNVIYNIADFDEIASALLVQPSGSSLVGRSQSFLKMTFSIADSRRLLLRCSLLAVSTSGNAGSS
jgi:hypothetical protein